MFKTLSLFLQSILVLAEEAQLHEYPEDEARGDHLAVDRSWLAPGSKLTNQLLTLVQVLSRDHISLMDVMLCYKVRPMELYK